MTYRILCISLAAAALAVSSLAGAEHSPQHERHELMEDVGKAAKVVGKMLRGEAEYDAAAAMQSLETFRSVSGKFGDLFPEGSETGEGTEAAPAIWEDRAGFDAALQDWVESVDAAIAAAPATLDEAKPALGPVFKTCKDCHDSYRIEDE